MRLTSVSAVLGLAIAAAATPTLAQFLINVEVLPSGFRPTGVDQYGTVAGVGPGGVFLGQSYLNASAPGATAAWNGAQLVSSTVDN